ncbi:LOW QUALITY PROTEIN: hypothetical protein IFM47457_10031 [Aspergillus lentulus]|nr:LOW QUALITY PROTEIN: hypothetical protein IFM47457_10031 [Aspergillus lentulus]
MLIERPIPAETISWDNKCEDISARFLQEWLDFPEQVPTLCNSLYPLDTTLKIPFQPCQALFSPCLYANGLATASQELGAQSILFAGDDGVPRK